MLLVGSLFVVFLLSSFPRFDTSDDLTMQWIANGVATADGPSGHLVFTNVVIGAPVAALYRLVPDAPWYAMYLYAVELVAATTVAYVVLARDRLHLPLDGPVLIGLLLTVWWSGWLRLQFTTAAFLIGFAGIALHLGRSHLPAAHRWTPALAGVLCGVGALVRYRSAFGVALLAAPLLVTSVRRVPLRRQMAFAIAAIVVAGSGLVANAVTDARHPEWSEYRAFNAERGALHGTPQLADVGLRADNEALAAAGWTVLQYDLFRSWQFFDEDLYSTETISALRHALPHETFDGGQQLHEFLADHRWRLALLLAVMGAAAITMSPRSRLEVLGLGIWTAATMSWLAINVRLPFRISLPLLAFVPIVAICRATATAERPPPRGPATRAVVAAIVLVSVLMSISAIDRSLSQSAEQRIDHERSAGLIDRVFATDPDGLYLIWANTLGQEQLSAFYEGYPRTIRYLPTGWLTRSPHQGGVLAANEIDHVYRALLERDDFYMVYTPNLGIESMTTSLYERQYGTKVEFVPVEGWGTSARIRIVQVREVR